MKPPPQEDVLRLGYKCLLRKKKSASIVLIAMRRDITILRWRWALGPAPGARPLPLARCVCHAGVPAQDLKW